jgi:hypothetical protein
MSASGTAPAKRRKKIDYFKWAAGIAVPIVVAAIGLLKHDSSGKQTTPGNFTYIGSISIIEKQIQQFTGGPVNDAVKAQIQSAVNLAQAGQYEASRPVFEQLATAFPIPAILTAAGTMNAEKGDAQAATRYYEQALAKDPRYAPALDNLAALKTVKVEERPISGGREVEPNNDIPHANILGLNTSALAEISGASDTDYYRFSTGHPPRDVYRISLKNLSTTLAPGINVYDQQKNYMFDEYRDTPGADLERDFVPAPDSIYYVQVFQRGSTSGAYSLTVKPLLKYDKFEPNDDIPSAKPLALGSVIDANIMDPGDTDYFQVQSGGAPGNLTVSLKNTSTTLAPGINVYDSQKSYLTNAYRDTPGADVDLTFATQPNSKYYIQIFQRITTAGSYSLTVK